MEIRTHEHCSPQAEPANPSSLRQTQANSVVRSYFTEDGTVWLFRYDCNLITCKFLSLVKLITYLLLTEFEGRNVSYGPSFSPFDLWPKREARAP